MSKDKMDDLVPRVVVEALSKEKSNERVVRPSDGYDPKKWMD